MLASCTFKRLRSFLRLALAAYNSVLKESFKNVRWFSNWLIWTRFFWIRAALEKPSKMGIDMLTPTKELPNQLDLLNTRSNSFPAPLLRVFPIKSILGMYWLWLFCKSKPASVSCVDTCPNSTRSFPSSPRSASVSSLGDNSSRVSAKNTSYSIGIPIWSFKICLLISNPVWLRCTWV